MKQFFQIVRGILYALVLFELLTLLGGHVEPIGNFLSTHSIAAAGMLLLLCLFLTWIRRACGKRTEYLVTMEPGAYGRIGSIFHAEKFDYPERLAGGFLSGVHTYRAQDGSLLFTVHQPGTGNPFLRTACAVMLTIVLLVPLSGVSAVNTANETIGAWFEQVFTTDSPQLDEPEPDTSANSWLTDLQDWIFHFLDGGKYILPSDKRQLTDNDIQGMDAAQIQRAINEIYARHGCPLTSSADKEYFESQDWYTPDPNTTQAQAWEQFSDIERKNIDFLVKRRDQLKS